MNASRIACALALLLGWCQASVIAAEAVDPGIRAGAIPVRVARDGTRFILLRDGKPYAVRGAGVEFGSIGELAARGGNSFRTWRTENGVQSAREVLDEAARHGLTVAMCIEIGRERLKFNYDDKRAVAKQLEYARREVMKYKDHPALLAWIIGNEPNLRFKNPKVFDAINDISKMIHEVDPHHPTTTALSGFNTQLATLIATRAPDLDFISIQMYGDIVNLPRYLAEAKFDKPYMVTEWGATGHWEVPKTRWGSAIEHDSSEKAAHYRKAYETIIASGDERLLGGYVFLWGQKQERTPTWYGMFLADGSATETVDFMQYAWTGAWPGNRAPRVDSFTLDSKRAIENVVLAPGQRVTANVVAADPEQAALRYSWNLVREIKLKQDGGDDEPMPPTVHVEMAGVETSTVSFEAPRRSGAYRLFVYVHDGAGSAGHANIPFYVTPPGTLPPVARPVAP
jgi:Glycosyl hydrolases family 2, TIM barrel domain